MFLGWFWGGSAGLLELPAKTPNPEHPLSEPVLACSGSQFAAFSEAPSDWTVKPMKAGASPDVHVPRLDPQRSKVRNTGSSMLEAPRAC